MVENNDERSASEDSEADADSLAEIPEENIEQMGNAVAAFIEGREGYIPVLAEIDVRRMDGENVQDLVAEFVTDFPMTNEFAMFCAFVEDHDRSTINELLTEATKTGLLTESHINTFWNLWVRFDWLSEATVAFARLPHSTTLTGMNHIQDRTDDDGDIIVREQGTHGIDELYEMEITVDRLVARAATSLNVIDQVLQDVSDDESLNEDSLRTILSVLNRIESMSDSIQNEVEFRLEAPDIETDEVDLTDQFDT